MRKWMMWSGLMMWAGTVCLGDTPPAPTAKGEGPCKQIIQACEAAGYQKNMHKTNSKGLYLDCLDPILKGQSVSGVTVDPALIPACQQRKAQHQAKKAAHGQMPPTAPPVK